MVKFNYNLFKSNCNSLSKQFNQAHSTCVVYHDICQQSVARPINTSNLDACGSNDSDEHLFQCQNQTCSDLENNSTTNSDLCKTSSTNTNTHHHHHNHEHGLIYSKRVRSILLLNALLSKPSNQVKESQVAHSPFITLGSKWQQIRNYAKKASTKDKRGVKNVKVSDEELSECIDVDKFRKDINEVVENLKNEFISNINIRIGMNIELLEINVSNQCYLLKDIARLSKKNNLITIDLSDLPEFSVHVMKAIRESGMNVNPQQDGSKIFFQQVKSTKEHREILARNCKTLLQKAKDALRSVQNDYINKANMKKGEKISVDVISNCCTYIRQAAKDANDVCIELYEQKVKQLTE